MTYSSRNGNGITRGGSPHCARNNKSGNGKSFIEVSVSPPSNIHIRLPEKKNITCWKFKTMVNEQPPRAGQ